MVLGNSVNSVSDLVGLEIFCYGRILKLIIPDPHLVLDPDLRPDPTFLTK